MKLVKMFSPYKMSTINMVTPIFFVHSEVIEIVVNHNCRFPSHILNVHRCVFHSPSKCKYGIRHTVLVHPTFYVNETLYRADMLFEVSESTITHTKHIHLIKSL